MARREHLLEVLRAEGSASVTDLAGRLRVSVETLRRDVRFLEERGYVLRSYGIVRARQSATFESPSAQRSQHLFAEKERIAAAAAARCGDARTVFVDEGFLPSLVAARLPAEAGRVVVTTSLSTAHDVAARRELTVIAVGGRVRPITDGVVDYWALAALDQMSFDLAFIGANGVDEEGYLTTPDASVAAVKAKAIERAKECIFIGDHTKFGTSTFARFGHLRGMSLAITDRGLPDSRARIYALYGPDVVRV